MYLYAPSTNTARMHVWEALDFSAGSKSVDLMPRWWNSTDSMVLSLLIVESGLPPALATLPAGPVFTATYSVPSTGVPASADTSKVNAGDGVTKATDDISSGITSSHHLSGGRTAAAVIVPLLVVILGILAWFKISRQKGKEKRKVWSEAVDKRMSTISTDWKSMSAAGANAAIRNSIAVSGNRNSSFSFGAIRPSSTMAVEGGQDESGAKSLYSQDNGSYESATPRPQMSQLRPGVRTSAFENRVSRVSFANDPRPSGESRRTRAFHTSTYEVPPLPTRPDSTWVTDDHENGFTGAMSPRQTTGPVALSSDQIRASIDDRTSFDEVLPALSCTFLSLFSLVSYH